MIEVGLDALAQADDSIDKAIRSIKEKSVTTSEMIRRLVRKPEGWTAERQVATLSVLLATAFQRLVIQDVMHGDSETGSEQLDWPEGELPG